MSFKLVHNNIRYHDFSDDIEKITLTGLLDCRVHCEQTAACNGVVWTSELNTCQLKGGDVKISGDKALTWSIVMPCP